MTEDQLEQETLVWLQGVGYTHLYGPDIAHDGPAPERSHYRQVLLPFRLREAILKLNPDIPSAAREDAFKQILDLGIPALLSANQHFHRLLVTGVPVQYRVEFEPPAYAVNTNDSTSVRAEPVEALRQTQGERVGAQSERMGGD